MSGPRDEELWVLVGFTALAVIVIVFVWAMW